MDPCASFHRKRFWILMGKTVAVIWTRATRYEERKAWLDGFRPSRPYPFTFPEMEGGRPPQRVPNGDDGGRYLFRRMRASAPTDSVDEERAAQSVPPGMPAPTVPRGPHDTPSAFPLVPPAKDWKDGDTIPCSIACSKTPSSIKTLSGASQRPRASEQNVPSGQGVSSLHSRVQ